MMRLFRHLLLVAALIGLLGQAAAYAAGPRWPAASMPTASAMADCMQMMEKQKPAEKPCKGITLDCMAAMGCTLPVLLKDGPEPSTIVPSKSLGAFWPPVTALAGEDLAPEPDPPSVLG